MLQVSSALSQTYPGASVGLMVIRDVSNPDRHPDLERQRERIEGQLRSQFSGYDRAALRATPTLQAYGAYYKRFKKTYHVQLQLESIVLKGKSVASAAALVEAMFLAELKNLLLTAGHDMDSIRAPLRLAVSDGSERYLRLGGREQILKPSDMFIADAQGVVSSVIYGPDNRTRITSVTCRALYTVYAPPGIEEDALWQHMKDIRDNILLFAPDAEVDHMNVYPAGAQVSEHD